MRKHILGVLILVFAGLSFAQIKTDPLATIDDYFMHNAGKMWDTCKLISNRDVHDECLNDLEELESNRQFITRAEMTGAAHPYQDTRMVASAISLGRRQLYQHLVAFIHKYHPLVEPLDAAS
jgi:hypothetical protein